MDETRALVIQSLLKSLYSQDFISEDVYHHSLDNLSKRLDYGRKIGYDVIKSEKEVEVGGRL